MNTHLVAEYTLTGAGDCTGHYGFRSVKCMLYMLTFTKESKDANIAQDIYIHCHNVIATCRLTGHAHFYKIGQSQLFCHPA